MQTKSSPSLGLYVHIPFCLRKCSYCAFYSVTYDENLAADTVGAIIAEMAAADLNSVDTVYIGGGTPTCIPAAQLLRIVEHIRSRAAGIKEFTVEASPSHLLSYPLSQLRSAGVDRLSVGVQSFSEEDLAFLGRDHTVDDACESIFAARQAGFGNLSVDLIFAVPGSDSQSWLKTLRRTISLSPEHISAYSLSYEERTPLTAERDRRAFRPVGEDSDRALYDLTIDTLCEAGYHWYEISNFASPARECLHNMKYWANDEYIGVGPAAGGWHEGIRYANTADVEAYIRNINSGRSVRVEQYGPSQQEIACETAVLNLRRTAGIDPAEFRARTGFDPGKLFAYAIEKYVKLGLMVDEPGKIALTRQGAALADSILVDFSSP